MKTLYDLKIRPLGTADQLAEALPTAILSTDRKTGQVEAVLQVEIQGEDLLDDNGEFFGRLSEVLGDPDYFVSLTRGGIMSENERALALQAKVNAERAVLMQEYTQARESVASIDHNSLQWSAYQDRFAKARVALRIFDQENGFI